MTCYLVELQFITCTCRHGVRKSELLFLVVVVATACENSRLPKTLLNMFPQLLQFFKFI